MRKTLSWIAILVLVFPVAPVAGTDVSGNPSNPARTLQDRLRDMSREAALYLDGSPESELLWLQGVDVQESAETEDSTETTRLRTRIRQLSVGAKLRVVLRDGEQVAGEFAGATAEEFSLNVPRRSGPSTVKLMRTFRYEDIQRADVPEVEGWNNPQKIRELPMGKRIELLLLDGTKLKGKLTSLSAEAFAVELSSKEVRELSFDEVASVRSAGMSGAAKAAIIVSVTVGALFVLGAALAPYLDR